MFCNNCGNELKDTAKFCPACGTKVAEEIKDNVAAAPKGSNKTKIIVGITICAIIILTVILAIGLNSKNSKEPIADISQIDDTEATASIENITDDSENSIDNARIDEMFDDFLADKIPAIQMGESQEPIYYSTLCNIENIYSSYSEGERIDLDNDGEKELIIDGDFGGMYLDLRGDQVYIFAEGGGTASWLSHVYYEDAYWIVYSDSMHQGRSTNYFEKYSGAENLVDSFEFSAYYWDQDEYDENSEFVFRDKNITMQEYERLNKEIFGKYFYNDSKVPFYGIWVYGSKDSAQTTEFAGKVEKAGFTPDIFFTPQWDNLNPEPYYVVSAGLYDTEDAARLVLNDVINAGFEGAYIKFSGNYK